MNRFVKPIYEPKIKEIMSILDDIDDHDKKERILSSILSELYNYRYKKDGIKICNGSFKIFLDKDGAPILTYPLFDHTCIMYLKDKKCWVFEPYYATMLDVEKLIKICKEKNLTFFIDGDSQHFPGRTFRIVITKE